MADYGHCGAKLTRPQSALFAMRPQSQASK